MKLMGTALGRLKVSRVTVVSLQAHWSLQAAYSHTAPAFPLETDQSLLTLIQQTHNPGLAGLWAGRVPGSEVTCLLNVLQQDMHGP